MGIICKWLNDTLPSIVRPLASSIAMELCARSSLQSELVTRHWGNALTTATFKCAGGKVNPVDKLIIRWIPGHMEIEGNELADMEANKAAWGDASPNSALPTMLRNPLPASTSAVRRAYKETIKRDAAVHLAKSKRYPRPRDIDGSIPSAQFRKLTAGLTREPACPATHWSHPPQPASSSHRSSPPPLLLCMSRERRVSSPLHDDLSGVCSPLRRTRSQTRQRFTFVSQTTVSPKGCRTTALIHFRNLPAVDQLRRCIRWQLEQPSASPNVFALQAHVP